MGWFSDDLFLCGYLNRDWTAVMDALTGIRRWMETPVGDAACLRWFGGTTQVLKDQIGRQLTRMRSKMNVDTVKVSFLPLHMRPLPWNAAAATSAGLVGLGTPLPQAMGSNLFLGRFYRGLPDYLPVDGAGQIDGTALHQSKLNTLVHELSHNILGTQDHAYGTHDSLMLAPVNASVNAENFGIFVEACSRNIS